MPIPEISDASEPSDTAQKRQVTNTLDGFIKNGFDYIDAGDINAADEIFSALLEKYPNHPGCLFGKALIAYHERDFVEAKRILYQLSQKSVIAGIYDEYLALIAFEQNRFDEAKFFVKNCLDAVPTNAFFQRNMGFVFLKQHNYSEAIKYFTNAITLNPNYGEAFFLNGYAYEKSGEWDKALSHYESALKINPLYTEAILGFSHYLLINKDLQNAIIFFEKALSSSDIYQKYQRDFSPNRPKTLLDFSNSFIMLSDLCFDKKKYTLAIILLETYILINPRQILGYLKLGILYKNISDHSSAIEHIQNVLKIDKNNLEAFFQLAKIYLKTHDYLAAIPFFEKILAAHLYDKLAYLGLGTCLFNTGKYDLGLHYLNKTLELFQKLPNDTEDWVLYDDALFNISNIELLLGNFKHGFSNYQFRLPRSSRKWEVMKHLDSLGYPELISTNKLQGAKIFLINEQGFGDAIQFLRFCKRLKSYGANLAYIAPTQLHRLAEQIPEISLISRQITLPRPDEYIFHLASAGYLFKLEEKDFSDNFNYLKIDKMQSSYIDTFIYTSKSMKIGLCYQGSQTHPNDKKRSISLDLFADLLKIDDAEFFSLVINLFDQNYEEQFPNLKDLRANINDLYDTAGIIDKMDLVITVDTVVAHLAGTLNKPCWVLIPYVPDWRWQLNREDSPWYPSLRLFRQKEDEPWSDVIKRIRKALKNEYQL